MHSNNKKRYKNDDSNCNKQIVDWLQWLVVTRGDCVTFAKRVKYSTTKNPQTNRTVSSCTWTPWHW